MVGNTPPLKDEFQIKDGKLTIKNGQSEAIYFGKNKRDWVQFTVEFKVRVAKGTKAWFLGKISGGEQKGQFSWDKLPLSESSTSEKDDQPHFFRGVKDDTWTTVCVRFIGKDYDVIVDGTPYKVRVQDARGGVAGGFGFLVGKGQVEIEGVKARVVSRKGGGGDGEE